MEIDINNNKIENDKLINENKCIKTLNSSLNDQEKINNKLLIELKSYKTNK